MRRRLGGTLFDPNNPDQPREPLLSVGAMVSAVAGAVALLTAFNVVHLSDAQDKAVLAAAAFVAPFVVALLGRRRVFAPATVAEMVQEARRPPKLAGPAGPERPGSTLI